MPKVSIIIPNYNRSALIRETLDNMLSQSFQDKEVLVVDDGSTDDSHKVLDSYGDSIRWYPQRNQGPGAARNLGLQHATGEFVQFMDSDDLASLNKIEDQLRHLDTQNADIAYGPWLKTHLDKGKAIPDAHVLQQGPLPSGASPLQWHLTHWSTVLQSCLFRRSIIDIAGGFRQDWWIAEDQNLLQKCLLAGAKLVHTPDNLTLYRLHDSAKLTTTGTSSDRKCLDWARFLLDSRQQILEKAPREGDPLTWRGYRRRLGACRQDLLNSSNPSAQALISSIDELLPNHNTPFIKLEALGSRIWRGLKSRCGQSRENATFATSHISMKHLSLIAELGYHIDQ